jgi:hypothetical protein
MAIFTPRGLKIRLSTDLAFTLLARLHPKVKAFEVLKMVEGIELLPTFSAFLAGLFLLSFEYSPIEVGIWVCFATVSSGILYLYGIFPSFLIRISSHLSVISGYGLFTIIIVIVGLFFGGWMALLSYFIGRYSASIILYLIELLIAHNWSNKCGYPVFGSEINFFNAYKFCARKIDVTLSIDLKDGELEEGHWFRPFFILEKEWPTITERFTDLEIIKDGREKFEARERGREFLEGFQKLGYNRDRIGQSFISKVGAQKKEE